MTYTLFSEVIFGSGRSGLSTVGYRLYNADGTPNGSRITAGVTERGTGTGNYGATVTIPATTFVGEIRWDTGGGSPVYASTPINTSDAPSSASGGGVGSGAFLVTVTVLDQVNGAIPGATVRLTQGINNFVTTADGFGVATFSLDEAVYTVSVTKSGYTFVPAQIHVTGSDNFDVSMSAPIVVAPADPAQTTAYLVTRDGQGKAQPHVTITFQLKTAPGSDSYRTTPFSAKSDAAGLLQVPLRLSATYSAQRGATGPLVSVTVPSSGSTFALPQILGVA
jgi:hypothetical protein